MDQIQIKTGTRLRAQHHPHDVAAFLVVGRNLRKIAGFEERPAGVVIMQIHFERSFFKVKHWYCNASLKQTGIGWERGNQQMNASREQSPARRCSAGG
jgi:hypothetical protein